MDLRQTTLRPTELRGTDAYLPFGISFGDDGWLAIVITRVGYLYKRSITPLHGRGEPGATPQPMPRDTVVAALRDRGCHQTDIGDACYEADPEWQLRP